MTKEEELGVLFTAMEDLCEAYDKRERYPFSGMARLIDDQAAYMKFLKALTALMEIALKVIESED